MADSRIHDLTAIGTLAAGDYLAVDDASDLTAAAKTATIQNVLDLVVIPNDNDGTYSAITHTSGVLDLDFDDSDVGWVVTASGNITDITYSNGPTTGNQKRRTVEIVASASITVAFATIDVTDSGIPTTMASGDKFLADLVVTA